MLLSDLDYWDELLIAVALNWYVHDVATAKRTLVLVVTILVLPAFLGAVTYDTY